MLSSRTPQGARDRALATNGNVFLRKSRRSPVQLAQGVTGPQQQANHKYCRLMAQ
jgi:hypothetical protein